MRLSICLIQRKITLTQKKSRAVASSVGDIVGTVFNQAHTPDLSWLDLDESEYRKFEALPKQNFDLVPDIEEFLSKDSQEFVPAPVHIMVNTNPLEHPTKSLVNASEKIRERTVRLVMKMADDRTIVSRLASEFHPNDIKKSESTIRSLVSQRGLLGPVYFHAADFPQYHKTGSEDSKFITKYAKTALFVISDNDMDSLKFSRTRVSSSDKIPFESLVDHYKSHLDSQGLKFSTASSAKDSIRLSFSNPSTYAPNETQHVWSPVKIHSAGNIRSNESLDGFSADYLKFSKRMMSGHDDRSILLASNSKELIELAGQFGLLGHEYLDVDVLGGCLKTSFFLKKSKSFTPKYLVRRASCCSGGSECSCKDLESSSVFVSSVPVMTQRDFVFSCWKANQQGRLSDSDFQSIISSRKASDSWNTLCARVNTYRPAASEKVSVPHTQKLHFTTQTAADGVDGEEMRVFVAKLQNRGLSMQEIRTQLTLRYPVAGIIRNASVIREAMKHDGVLGHHHIDPSCYSDYGRGCESGSKLFRGTGPKNVVASSSCTGCVLQTHPGWCSKYAKNLIRPLAQDKILEIRTASAKKSLPVLEVAVRDPAKEWGLEKPSLDVELSGRKTIDIKVHKPE